MAPSPSSGGRTPSTRGRGRGRPRLRGRANSLLSGRRRTSSLPASVPESYTPTGRRRPVYQNGYRPGGAGGGGRYIDHSTGSIVPANVYNTTTTPAPNRRRAPVTPSVTAADGVYKPREEKSYIEFHPDLDVDATLECLSAEDVDGASYKPPECGKSVKIVDVKEEIEPQEERSTTGSRRWDIGMSLDGNGQNVDEILDTNTGIITSSFTTYSSALNEGVEKPLNLYNINLPIDPALAALTSPLPSELTTQIPIDPALSQVDHQLIPQTPAITPTEEVSITHPPVTPGPIRTSRRGDDGPTLASLRAHRSNAGKPPLRQTVAHPQSVRRPRAQTSTQASFEAEKLNLPKPSYRKITPFQFSEFAWSSSVGSTGPYGLNNPPSSYSMGSGKGRRRLEPTTPGSVDRSMALMGYQQTSLFTLPHTLLRDVPDLGIDEELNSVDILDRVEYDMDEQDDKWLTSINAYRLLTSAAPITREIFEITMTKIEKEWVTLEKKIPKVIAKPHSTSFSARRRRTTGDDEEEEEGAEDSKCAICDDGECENSNAIVFCDGCNLAVHQECYGVPYIPEGQWLCRKCLTIPRQTAHCIFCPNTDGAFKQTTTTRWSHLLCAIWIPEVRLANPAYMEPVDGMELVPKSRWRLTCYICKQKMGACIQCSNKSCFIAFHVTCGRRARLHMKMKNTSGPGAQLEASGLKAYCDKHVPADWRRENDVDEAVMDAMEFYHQTMAGRNWGDSQSAAMALPDPSEENSPPNGILVGGNLPRLNLTFGNKRKRNANPKSVWKLPSGAPVIPHVIYTAVVEFLSRFKVYKKEEYVAEACKYWTLKREARRGASLLKRLQLQMNSFTSVEVTRKNYAAMGHTLGTKRLGKRKEFTDGLISILGKLKDVTMRVEMRETERVEDAKALKDSLDSIYFPEVSLMREILEKAESVGYTCSQDHERVFEQGFSLILDRIENRLYPTVETFAMDMLSVLNSAPSQPLLEHKFNIPSYTPPILEQKKDMDDLSQEAATTILKQVEPLLDEAGLKEIDLRTDSISMSANAVILEAKVTQQRISDGKGDDEKEIAEIASILTGTNEDEDIQVDDAQEGGDDEGDNDDALSEQNGVKGAENSQPSSMQFTKESISSPKKSKAGVEGINGASPLLINMNMKTPTPTPRQMSPVTGINGDKSTPSPKKVLASSKKASSPRKKALASPDKKTLAGVAKVSYSEIADTSIPQRTEVFPKTPEAGSPVEKSASFRTPINRDVPTVKVRRASDGLKPTKKSDMDFAENEDLMGGYRLEDLPSPLGTVDGSNPSPDQEKVDNSLSALPAPAQSTLAAFVAATSTATNGVGDHDNTSVLSDPPDDEDVDIDAEGSTENEDEIEGLDRMDVDVTNQEDEEDEDLDAGDELEESESEESKGDGSAGSSSGGSTKKSRKGMVFARQSNGRFGSMKAGVSSSRGGESGAGGGSRGKTRKKKW
ncbi:uncharacterized protein H6S33_009422 [Morchella sextelata]|uniref:uncharacterized protein n=1 Tax=Morchella sextelata TaxID=1174677 RepID=UPI001D04E6C8|nr:uncharacterized protein H6S33_009422 [Morchella sextelata]KAH0613042.1 hypothetical protein H6S33_009422 [Morchella sextelata]